MKKLINPTTYFFEQAQLVPTELSPQIQQFRRKLLNKDICQLCKSPYDIYSHIPRILIHCGHTFCTPCISQFHIKNRVRCPMCLKLVKKLNQIQRLPINHTIFTYLMKKQDKENNSIKNMDGSKFLYSEFQRVQKEAHKKQNPQKYDDQSGLAFCVFHSDRVEHFYCQSHKTFGCRVCIQVGHSRGDCQVIDLYTVDNPLKYQNKIQNKVQLQSYPIGCFSSNNYVRLNSFGVKNANSDIKNETKAEISGNYYGFNNILDPKLLDDQQQEQEQNSCEGNNKSF